MDMPTAQTTRNRTDIVMVFSGLLEPVDLEFEPESQTLYWAAGSYHWGIA
jgi:hypothetical protein